MDRYILERLTQITITIRTCSSNPIAAMYSNGLFVPDSAFACLNLLFLLKWDQTSKSLWETSFNPVPPKAC